MRGSTCFVTITGAAAKLDRFCDEHLSRYEIHPEKVLRLAEAHKELLPEGAFFPMSEDTGRKEEKEYLAALRQEYSSILTSGDRGRGLCISPEAAERVCLGIKNCMDALQLKKKELKKELDPMAAEFRLAGKELLSATDPEERLSLGKRINELHEDVSRIRQCIYEVDLKIAEILKSNAADIDAAARSLSAAERREGLRRYGAVYEDPKGRRYFVICGFMKKKAAESLRAELEDSGFRISLRSCRELRELKTPVSRGTYRIMAVCPGFIKRRRIMAGYQGMPFSDYWSGPGGR